MDVQTVLKTLPEEPGVYLYRDANGTVIYVGKARVLKNRVRSYFHSSDLNAKTRQLVSVIADIEYIVTGNELEALLLENNLIKKYKPKYNILLKDDKGYPYLRIDPHEDFPRLELARRMAFDGAQYFGPYHGAGSARAIADIALELYPLRTCNHDFSKKTNVRPCLKYHIARCPGPCVNKDRTVYHENVKKVIEFLKGDQSDALDAVRAKMEAAAERLEFEYAAELRDKIKKADEILNKQKIVLDKNEDLDVVSLVMRDTYAVVCSLHVRSGRLIGVNLTELPDVTAATENELLSDYLLQYYAEGQMIPREILYDVTPDDKEVLEELLSDAARRRVYLRLAQKGKKFDLCLMARRNAKERLEKSQASADYREDRVTKGLKELAERLKLPDVPHRMECFDISHIQGTDTVASMVVATDGRADRKEYRHFKIRTATNDDFTSMREVTERRFTELLKGRPGFEKTPDLIIIDGGKGQLNAACSIVHDQLGLDIPMISLAERLEEIYLPGQDLPLLLPFSAPSLQILQAIRDEAHRFAITFHRSLHNKHSLISVLDSIPHIGAARKKALMKAFRSVNAIKEASVEELLAVPGMNAPSAQAVYAAFHKQENT